MCQEGLITTVCSKGDPTLDSFYCRFHSKGKWLSSSAEHRCNQHFSSKLPPTQRWVSVSPNPQRGQGLSLQRGLTTTEPPSSMAGQVSCSALGMSPQGLDPLGQTWVSGLRVPEDEFLLFQFYTFASQDPLLPLERLAFHSSFVMCCY